MLHDPDLDALQMILTGMRFASQNDARLMQNLRETGARGCFNFNDCDAEVTPCNNRGLDRPTFLISCIFILSNLDICENSRVVVRVLVLPGHVNLYRNYLRRINQTGQTAWLTRQKRVDPCDNVFLFRADGSEAAVEGAPPPGEERLDQLQRGRRSAGFWQHQRRSSAWSNVTSMFSKKVACYFG